MSRINIRRLQYALPAALFGLGSAAAALFMLDGLERVVFLGLILILTGYGVITIYRLQGDIERSETERAEDVWAIERKAEDAVAVRTAFAKAASHDMLEPLRKVEAFGERLEDKYAMQLDDGGRLYIDRMRDAARRMRHLTEQLLTFARLDDQVLASEALDISVIAKAAQAEHQSGFAAAEGVLKVESAGSVISDAKMLTGIFSELIGNAIKFRSPDHPLHIEIRHERVECTGGIREKITISDDGIGFDPRFSERIFGVLDRLHSRSEFEGTGMGLAIARKMTERLGGSLTANAEPETGACFTLILPVQQ